MNSNRTAVRIARSFSPALAFVFLMLAAAQWIESSRAADTAASPVEWVETAGYFPAGYVNQAQQYEDHIQAF